MTPQQLSAVRFVASAIVTSVRAAGAGGAPAGIVQSRMVKAGCTRLQHHGPLGCLIRGDHVVKRGSMLFATMKPL